MKHFALVFVALGLAACGHNDSSASSDAVPDTGGATSAGAQIFVVNGGDATLSVIDVATNKVTNTIGLGDVQYPHHVSVSADGSTLMVAVPGVDFSHGHDMGSMGTGMQGAVLKVDADSGKVLVKKTLPLMNHNAAYSPDGKEVWTSQMDMPGSVLVLNSDTLDTISTVPADHMPSEVTFSADGKTVFVANEMTNDVYAIDVATKTLVNKIYVPKGPVGAWAGTDDVMYADSEEGKAITAIDAKTRAAINTFSLGFTPGMAATAPDGSLWVTDGDDGAVAILNAKSGSKSAQITTAAGAHGIIFSTDGATAYVTNQFANSVSVIDVKKHEVVATVPVGTKPNGLVFRKAR
jgi:YVTN family beta-propeller protein